MHKWIREGIVVVAAALMSLVGLRAPAADMPITYTVPQPGRVSLAIYNAEGQLVRTLATGAPRPAGSHVARWDGLDRYGHPLPPGEYTWKALATTGLRAEFITQVGQNPDPVWEKSVCNHEPPLAAAVDATGVYRIGTFDEGAHAGVKTDLNGRHLWTTNRDKTDPWCRFGAALTIVDGHLFDLIHNGTLYRYEASSGRCLTSSSGAGLWNLRWEGGPAKVEGKAAEPLRRYVERTGTDLSGASAAKLLIASYRQHNAIRWFSIEEGKQVGEANVPEPVAVAGMADGTALVISMGAVVAVSRDGQTRTIVPADQLVSPWRLCVSPATADVFVAENSTLARGPIERPKQDYEGGVAPDLAAGVITKGAAGHHQVKRFASEGKLLAALGRPEGRQDGVYVPTDFRGITDIEADHEGGFVITEGHQQPPRRSARFDASGKLLREWYGAQQYGVLATPEPGNPEYVWIHANASPGAMMRCRVDYANKSWRVVEIYRDSLGRHPLWGNGHQLFRIVERDGRLHFFSSHDAFKASIYDPASRTMRLANASGTKLSGGDFWNDLNDDGMPQAEEMVRFGQQMGGTVAGAEWTLFTTPHSTGYRPGPKLLPQRFTAGGTPVYACERGTTWPKWHEDSESYHAWDIVAAPDGGWYACLSDALRNPHEGHENHGAWYFNSCSGIDRLVKWDKDWKQVWSVGRHSPDFDHEPGSTAMPRGVIGVMHGCIVWADASDEEIARPTVWTEDGLYVDELLRVPTDPMPKEMHGLQNNLEFVRGHLAIEPGTGQALYYTVSTAGGSPIYRISGWDNLHRQSGKLTLASAVTQVAKRDGTGLQAEYFASPDLSGEPAVVRTDKVVYFHWLKNLDSLPDGLSAEGFSARWTGQVEAPTSETYRFVFETLTPWRGEGWGTAGVPPWLKLWVGGQLLTDTAAGLAQPTSNGFYGEAQLRAGERYDLRLECSYAGNAVAKLCWETPTLDRRTILPAFLHPTPGPQADMRAPARPRPEVIADIGFEDKEGALSWSRTGVEIFGRMSGNARRIPGRIGQGIELEARGEFEPALFPIDEELQLPDADYTVAFWFRTTAPAVRLCEAKRYSAYNNRWSDHQISLSEGKVRFALQGDKAIETSTALSDGQWHYVVTTVGGDSGQRLYVDGQLVGEGKLRKRTRTSNRLPLDLGPGGGQGLVGMDELKVFGRALGPAAVAELYRAPSASAGQH